MNITERSFVSTLATLATAASLLVMPTASAAAPGGAGACGPGENLRFLCGLSAPEDLVLVPGTDWIVASSLADPGAPVVTAAPLTLIDSRRRTSQPVVPAVTAPRAPYDDCAGPPDFTALSTHGMSIRSTGPGTATMLVVGHGAREAVEVFDVATRGRRAPSFTWAGCIPAVDGAFNNSVVGLPDGRVIVTDFIQSPSTFEDIFTGQPTGAIYDWRPGGAWKALPGTAMSGPNGLEVTRDLRYLLVAESGTSSLLRFDLAATDKAPVRVRTDFRTDNLRWTSDGRLLAAGPRPDDDCAAGAEDCRDDSVVASLDPTTMDLDVVLDLPAEPNFSEITTALAVDGRLWLGSATGDRVAYAKPQDKTTKPTATKHVKH